MTDQKIQVVDYLPEHLAQIELRKCHNGERPSEINNKAITFILDGKPIAIFTWYFISTGVVHVCGLLSDDVTKKSRSFHKSVLLFIGRAFEIHKLQRMQITVLVGFDEGRYWAQSLGFEYEGVMRKFGPGGVDHWLFAKVAS